MSISVVRWIVLTLLFLTVASPAQTAAEPSPNVSAASGSLPPNDLLAFTKYRLKNGLEVILHQDHSLPMVALNLWYHVGPSNEPPRRSGFAHLFEHLMFEGSAHVGRDFDIILESIGATNSNATTDWDRTNYFETVPREGLELVLWLESDRMGFLLEGLTPQRLEVQRGVVKNERRENYENAPYGASGLAMVEALFEPGHPYHGAIIGSMRDIDAASFEDVRHFFQAFYAPSNATLALAGDFDPVPTRALIDRYFGSLPERPGAVRWRPERRRATPPLKTAKRVIINEHVQLGRLALGWITPPAFTPDDCVLHVVMSLLAGGKATRLYQELVVEQRVSSEVSASLDSTELGSMVGVTATRATGTAEEKLEKALDGALEVLRQRGPTEQELSRAKRRIRLQVMDSLQLFNSSGGDAGQAGILQRFNHYLGDPGGLAGWLAQIDKVSRADVMRVMGHYLMPATRVVVVTREETKTKAGP
ncbi:MAG TPA: pitrilysin family protein [Polyangiaceae bacterium]